MTSIKIRINKSRKNKEGQFPLVLQVIHLRRKREIYTPYRLYKDEFNSEKEILRIGRRRQERIAYIREATEYVVGLKKTMTDICNLLEAKKKNNYTVDDVVLTYKQHSNYNYLFVFSEYLLSTLKKEGKEGTFCNYGRAIKSFERFVNDPSFTFDKLTPQLLERYRSYLRQRGNRPNTVWFYLYQLRVIYRKAVSMYIVHSHPDPFSSIEIKKEKTLKRAIAAEGIQQIAFADLLEEGETACLARDLFMFSFYTRGMSFVDMCYLREENIKGDILSYRRKKTGQLLEMKIEPELKALIGKYTDPDSPYLLPMLRQDNSYQRYRQMQRKLNKGIQRVGKQLKFTSPLTFYVARHSWATMARDEGVPISIISSCMGHTSEKTTRIYLAEINHDILDKANNLVLNAWNSKKKKNALLPYKRAGKEFSFCS